MGKAVEAKGNAAIWSPAERVTRYLREVRAELKKVVWPTPRQTASYSGFVVFMSVLTGLIILALDTIFNFGLNHFIR